MALFTFNSELDISIITQFLSTDFLIKSLVLFTVNSFFYFIPLFPNSSATVSCKVLAMGPREFAGSMLQKLCTCEKNTVSGTCSHIRAAVARMDIRGYFTGGDKNSENADRSTSAKESQKRLNEDGKSPQPKQKFLTWVEH